MRKLKFFLKTVLIFFIVIILLAITWTIWQYNRDAITVLDREAGNIISTKYTTMESRYLSENREYYHLNISTENIGMIEAYISLPLVKYTDKIPVIIIMGGLEIGIHNFRYVSQPGNNALIIYQYPYQPDQWRNNSTISQIPIVQKAILDVPIQMIKLIDWINKQSWADTSRINLTGYSFGAMFVPAVYHLDNHYGARLGPGVIAYGGVDIYKLLMTNIKKPALPFRMLGSWFASAAIQAIEPEIHLPYMNNEFFLINGNMDTQIPEVCWKRLHELTPDPKTILILDEGHMHPNNTELTMKLVNLSKKWLRRRNVINP